MIVSRGYIMCAVMVSRGYIICYSNGVKWLIHMSLLYLVRTVVSRPCSDEAGSVLVQHCHQLAQAAALSDHRLL